MKTPLNGPAHKRPIPGRIGLLPGLAVMALRPSATLCSTLLLLRWNVLAQEDAVRRAACGVTWGRRSSLSPRDGRGRGVAAMCGGAWEEAADWAGSIMAVDLWPWPDLWASLDCWQAWFRLLAIGSRCLRWFGDVALLPGVVGSVCSLGGPLILMALVCCFSRLRKNPIAGH
ncbi:hypothetical protein ACLOJK_041951 [Asimina triloba]